MVRVTYNKKMNCNNITIDTVGDLDTREMTSTELQSVAAGLYLSVVDDCVCGYKYNFT